MPIHATGLPVERSRKPEGKRTSFLVSKNMRQCQRIVTWGLSMESVHLSALGWNGDGELIPCDRLDLLKTLVQESLPDVQFELIEIIETMPVEQVEATSQVTPA